MDRFHINNAASNSNRQNSLLDFGRTYQSFAELLSDDWEDDHEGVAKKRPSASRKSLDQLNIELAEIAFVETALMRAGEWDSVQSADRF